MFITISSDYSRGYHFVLMEYHLLDHERYDYYWGSVLVGFARLSVCIVFKVDRTIKFVSCASEIKYEYIALHILHIFTIINEKNAHFTRFREKKKYISFSTILFYFFHISCASIITFVV